MFKGFQKPKRLVANTESLNDRYGMFHAQPFERGFGTTIGVGLRRILLSSIEGAAITAVRIEGVDHEFSPIPGVTDDSVLRFILSGEAVSLHEAEEKFLDTALPAIFSLIGSGIGNEELARHPWMQLLLAHGSRGWEDSLL